MPETLKTETVNGDTYRLYRQPTEMKGKQFEYFVTENGTSEASRATKMVFSMKRGKELFEETIRQVQNVDRGGGRDTDDADVGGLFGVGLGGGDPPSAEDDPLSLGFGDGDADDDDEGFRLL